MSSTYLHHPKEESDSQSHHRLSWVKQMFETQPFPNAKNSGHFPWDGEIQICDDNRPKHGLLFYAVIRGGKKTMRNQLTVGPLPI